ncbi:MAG: sn-glycerol-1-phosphate dehydrogenase [Alistipes sp.]|nr:sn-glycerol-1-phosphate dehydrogenase [Alistipes sp.]MBQ1957483.1 sn-glycerol-1-phosphate dehydrogenase [Alistipes sp.]
MNQNPQIAAALAAATDTSAMEIGIDILDRVPQMFVEQFPAKRALIVADENTWRAAGEAVYGYLQSAGVECEEPYIFTDPHLHAEWKFIEELDERLAKSDAIPVSVGSGTINDLCKLCSYHQSRPYMCVATAASVDGYSSFGASITYKNMKQTFTCPAPKAILADVGVMAKAPKEMTAAGYADLAAKIPAGAEWIIADFVGSEPIHDAAWHISQDGLKAALSDPEGVAALKPEAIAPFVEGLMLSGFAMQAARSSRPASCTDHLFSHLWNMRNHTYQGVTPSHGFQVSVGTLMMCAMFDQMYKSDFTQLDVDAAVAAWKSADQVRHEAEELFVGEAFAELGVTEIMAKYDDKDEVRRQLNLAKANWPDLKAKLQAQCYTFDQMYRSLSIVGAPVKPEDVGISKAQMKSDVSFVRHIRRRYNMMDLGLRAGLLDKWVDGVFGKGGVWEIK